jgi:hypothetical protein
VVAVEGLSTATRAFWTLAVGVVALYAFFLVIGALSPGDHPWVTAGAIVLAVLLAVHLVRVSRAMHDHAHEEELRELHKLRETRGF